MLKTWRFRYKEPPPTLLVLYQGTRVAELEKYAQGFVFRYLPDFKRLSLSPFPGLPFAVGDLPFQELPVYFLERLPDMKRPEIRERMRALRISADDTLRLLAELGSHSVTDPFVFQLAIAA